MKKILATAMALGMLALAGNVSALTFTDTYDPTDFKMSSHLSSADDTHSWQFDINDDGYNATSMEISSATIGLSLRDDGGWFDFWEYADLNVGTQTFSWEVDTGTSIFSVSSILTLSDTGLLDVSLKADAGDFWFQSANLTAEGDYMTLPPSPTPTPEPATILLFGAGIIGLAGNRIRRKKK